MIISEGELKIADDLTRADVTVCLGGGIKILEQDSQMCRQQKYGG